MVGINRWQVGATLFASVLAVSGCSDSASKPTPDGGGGSNGGEDASGSTGTSGTSVTTVQLGDDTAGKACTEATQCEGEGTECLTTFETGGALGGALLGAPEAPGGYCSATCTDDAQCGKGGACVGSFGFGLEGQCEKTCAKDGDCRDGYECISLTAELEGFDPEMLPEDAAGMLPDGGVGELPEVAMTCRPKPDTAKLGNGVAGKACESAEDCKGSNTICQSSIGGIMGFGGTETPGGYCSGSCADDSHCGEGGVCVGAIAALVTGSCAAGCETDADCTREGYRCRPGVGSSTCLPAPPPLDDGIAGAACTGDAECGNGTCITTDAEDMPLGENAYCSQSCQIDADCGAGGVCYAFSVCVEACDTSAPACSRTGFTCTASQLDETAPGRCLVPEMTTPEPATCDPACGANATCNAGTCACDQGFEGDPAAGCTAVAAEATDAGTEADAAP